MQPLLITPRLALRHLSDADATFLVAILNDAEFLQFIGDRGVRSAADAVAYLHNGTLQSYATHGYGMYCVERKNDGVAIGLCGLVRRDWLDGIDLGFAFLPAFRRQGYAMEATTATVQHAFNDVGLERLLAIVQPENRGSIALLDKLGMTLTGHVRPPGGEDELCLYELRREPLKH